MLGPLAAGIISWLFRQAPSRTGPRRDREDQLDLADIGSEAGAATHTEILPPGDPEPKQARAAGDPHNLDLGIRL